MVQTNVESVTLKIPRDVYTAIEDCAKRSGRSVAAVANEMLAEAVKMRRVPGIVFADGVQGRVPVVAGTGLQVFEIVGPYREVGEDWERLKQCFHWLDDQQLRAALAYAEAYPEEIEERLAWEEYWTPERIWATYPFMKPK
jgi:uncharacterized protein (DUF433 family)